VHAQVIRSAHAAIPGTPHPDSRWQYEAAQNAVSGICSPVERGGKIGASADKEYTVRLGRLPALLFFRHAVCPR